MKKNTEERLALPARGSRFMSCLLIAAVFIVIDLAILLYFLLPRSGSVDHGSNGASPPALEQQATPEAAPASVPNRE